MDARKHLRRGIARAESIDHRKLLDRVVADDTIPTHQEPAQSSPLSDFLLRDRGAYPVRERPKSQITGSGYVPLVGSASSTLGDLGGGQPTDQQSVSHQEPECTNRAPDEDSLDVAMRDTHRVDRSKPRNQALAEMQHQTRLQLRLVLLQPRQPECESLVHVAQK